MSTQQPPPTAILTMSHPEFAGRFGSAAFAEAVCGYTREADTHAVLTILAHARPRRVLEIGTALGHMTANLTRWTLDDTQIFSLGIVQAIERSAPGAVEQQVDQPTRGQFAQFANHFGKAWKVLFIQADSMLYDFGRLAPFDFAFIDGGNPRQPPFAPPTYCRWESKTATFCPADLCPRGYRPHPLSPSHRPGRTGTLTPPLPAPQTFPKLQDTRPRFSSILQSTQPCVFLGQASLDNVSRLRSTRVRWCSSTQTAPTATMGSPCGSKT